MDCPRCGESHKLSGCISTAQATELWPSVPDHSKLSIESQFSSAKIGLPHRRRALFNAIVEGLTNDVATMDLSSAASNSDGLGSTAYIGESSRALDLNLVLI